MRPTHELTENHYLVTHEVGPNQSGLRLDSFLRERYLRRSREAIKRAIDSGAITIKREQSPHLTIGKLKASTGLVAGDQVLVLSEKKPEPEVDFNYSVLYEDDVLLVIDKPANLPVHPAGRYFFNTLLTHLKTRGHREPYRLEHEYFLVHRIDKETSGVLVMAKQKAACTHLIDQFFEREVSKRYLAIVHGSPPSEFENAKPIGKARRSLIDVKMAALSEDLGGQVSYTRFRTLQKQGPYSLVECFPKTGRQHQIRVHLDDLGFPIVGDKLYGMPESEAVHYYERKHITPEAQARLILSRHALHASRIELIHPVTERPIVFESKLPLELEQLLTP